MKVMEEVTADGDTALHLAVKNKQFGSVKALVQRLGDNDRSELLDAKNEDGFTIFQLAKATNQFQVLKLLEGKDTRPLRAEDCTRDVEEIVIVHQERAADESADTTTAVQLSCESRERKILSRRTGSRRKENFANFSFGFLQMFRPPAKLIYDKNTLGVVATLIATVTYQAALTPPHSVLKENMKLHSKCVVGFKLKPKGCHSLTLLFYMPFNTLGFLSSVMPLIMHKAGPVPNYFILVALYAVIGSYITLLAAMSSGLWPVVYVLARGTIGFVVAFSFGYFVPKILERHRPSPGPMRRKTIVDTN